MSVTSLKFLPKLSRGEELAKVKQKEREREMYKMKQVQGSMPISDLIKLCFLWKRCYRLSDFPLILLG